MHSLAEKTRSAWKTSTLNLILRRNSGETPYPSSSLCEHHFPWNLEAFEIAVVEGVGDVDEVASLDSFGALHPQKSRGLRQVSAEHNLDRPEVRHPFHQCGRNQKNFGGPPSWDTLAAVAVDASWENTTSEAAANNQNDDASRLINHYRFGLTAPDHFESIHVLVVVLAAHSGPQGESFEWLYVFPK